MWPFASSSKSQLYEDDPAKAAGCPVDHTTRQKWVDQQQASSSNSSSNTAHPHRAGLSEEREVSSIPRWYAQQAESDEPPPQSGLVKDDKGNWVYPSPAQFHAALQRKGRSSHKESDMNIVVPIHNAVNERCWQEILKWEKDNDRGQSERQCGGPKLVSFKGKPKEVTWKAWMKGILGYQAPFDRHDWVIDRCGHRVRYIIDFYAGRSPSANPEKSGKNHPFASNAERMMSFYLDVRPAPDTFEGISMRIRKAARDIFSPETQTRTR
ncbi:unnamed protein product [Sympodiomycopsis kandeliae]